jgi:hypothetical protein
MRQQHIVLLGGSALLAAWLVAALLCQPRRMVRHPTRSTQLVPFNYEQPVHDLSRPLQQDGRATASELADLDRPLQCTCAQDTCLHPRGIVQRGHQETHLPHGQGQFRRTQGWDCSERDFG